MTYAAVKTAIPSRPPNGPPVILVHGAGTTSRVWAYWRAAFADAGWATHALDLRGHGDGDAADLARTSMYDYVDDVIAAASALASPPVVMGWSMGGHVAVIAASRGGFAGCVAFDPDPPVDRVRCGVDLERGVQTPEEIGHSLSGDPDELQGMPDLTSDERRIAQASLCAESLLMASERRRGILIDSMPCPLLEIVGGLDDYYPREPSYLSFGLAQSQIYVPDSSHWGLVLSRRVVNELAPQTLAWLAAATSGGGRR